ncbi:myelin and lymphocyte protein-like [Triplophysa rosa]|uniref:Myelin and lymphocyte protein n=1 Tax=Triplophysa rosa TaxID=992332 RepID=A0A9W8C1D6_TRIRA|nr:myelin and lymphocyte protein-like [Triplophysa rosa]KAI7805124.1 putative myelin and lymphocyte protein-like [Triplophysa rosa]
MSAAVLPSGGSIFTTLPDVLFFPEFVFGGLVWTLVASTQVVFPNPLGWVMFVSIFCFVMTTIWFFIFLTGKNQSGIWPSLDVGYHATAALFYLSASVLLALVTITSRVSPLASGFFKIYQILIAAVVMAFITTLLYCIHAMFSAFRWKSS